MSDQANDLRRLMVERAGMAAGRRAVRGRWIAVAGGKGGVGTTSVAIGLALADRKRKTLLVDADPRGGDAALHFGVDDQYTLCDLLSGRRRLSDVIQTGACGLRLVPGARGWNDLGHGPSSVVERLSDALGDSTVDVDTVMMDLGNSPNRTTSRLWQAADTAYIVTTAETAGIVGAYEAIKILTDRGAVAPPMFVVVNMAVPPRAAETAYRRLAEAAHRFLGVRLTSAGCHLTPKKEKTNLNFHAPAADTVRELSAAERLLNWTKRVKSKGTRESNLWPDSMQESSACWLF